MVSIKIFVFNPFQVNTYLIFDETFELIIIDPGCQTTDEAKIITSFIDNNNLTPKAIFHTHGHIDHIMGNKFIKDRYNIPIFANEYDKKHMEEAETQALYFGIDVEEIYLPDKFLSDNDLFQFGNTTLKVLHIPGHSPGSIGFYCEKEKFVITGDVLFYQTIGRTDIPYSDYDTIINSIKTKLLVLPDNTKVFPGHGRDTTIKNEKTSNPYLSE